MVEALTPQRWAIRITQLLKTVYGADRFPVDVPSVALEYTKQVYPNDAIVSVQGADLPNFDGALFRAASGRRGWGIIFNDRLKSKGRINFTLGHELGHYLLHREAYPKGFRCGEQDVVRWDSEYGQVEHQANVFAANLLMPYDDFRTQISAKAVVDFDALSHCGDRYGVSLVAATLRWLSYTERRAVLVASRDGFMMWARPSEAALRTGAYYRTAKNTIEVPTTSLAAQPELLRDGPLSVDHPADIWFSEPVREVSLFAEQYDFCLSLLLLEDAVFSRAYDGDRELDAYERMMPRIRGREW